MRRVTMMMLAALIAAPLLGGCETREDATPPVERTAQVRTTAAGEADDRAERVLATNLDRILAHADSIEQALRPVPLLTPGQIGAFNQFRNPQHLQSARRLGVPQPVTAASRDRLLNEGRLVRLDDNRYWTVRELTHSVPLATPDVAALLTEIGERFHERLGRLGLPPLRMEITSVLRTAEDQEQLRRVNPNAARGESTHMFGTTVDIAYSSFMPPQEPVLQLDTAEAPWLEPYLRRIENAATETGAARMSRELQAELGHVLRAMQSEGKVMVTMEVRQPVYHITVAQRY